MYKKTQEADFVEILKTVGKHVLIVLKADDNRKFNGIQKPFIDLFKKLNSKSPPSLANTYIKATI